MGLKNWIEPFTERRKTEGEWDGDAKTRAVGAGESRIPCWKLLLETFIGNPFGGTQWVGHLEENSRWETEMAPSAWKGV